MTMPRQRPRSRKHFWLALTLAAGCAGIGGGAYALFANATSTTSTVGAGTVQLDWEDPAGSQFSLPIGPLSPGGSTQQLMDLENIGTVAVAQFQLSYSTEPANALTNPSNGLQMRVDKCSVAWTGTPENKSCPGQATEVIPDRPVTGRTNILAAASTTVGGIDHLRFTFRLPESSPANAQNANTTVRFRILGNQRPGEQR